MSVENLKLDPTDRVWGFDLRLKEGRIIAICRIPDGWTITAQNYGEAALYKAGGGKLTGKADLGHDALDARGIVQLRELFLVDRSAVHSELPVLSGSLTIAGAADNRTEQLSSRNFRFRAANKCP